MIYISFKGELLRGIDGLSLLSVFILYVCFIAYFTFTTSRIRLTGSQLTDHVVDRVEEQLLVLLEVLVVGGRRALDGAHQADAVAEEATRLPSSQLQAVRVPVSRGGRYDQTVPPYTRPGY